MTKRLIALMMNFMIMSGLVITARAENRTIRVHLILLDVYSGYKNLK